MQITLQWPPRELSPNVRSHWTKKMKAKQGYRDYCFFDTKAQIVGKISAEGNVSASIVFHPPRNSGDIDNMLASAKSGIDGMCDALGINDKRLRPLTLNVGDKVPSGKIVITFGETNA